MRYLNVWHAYLSCSLRLMSYRTALALNTSRLDAISATNSPVYLSFFYNFISAYGCKSSWWRHQMETFPTLLTLCAGNSPVTGEFPSQRPVTRRFDVFLDLRLNKPLSKRSKPRWFETPSCSLWHHCNVLLHDATFFTMQSSINFPKRSDAYLRQSLRWRHNGCDSVSNNQPQHCLLNRLFRRRLKKTSKLRVTGLCEFPGTGEFSAQMTSYAENVSIWWRHHGTQPALVQTMACLLYGTKPLFKQMSVYC